MLAGKKEKKSETLEVRVAYSQKQTFMEACKRNGKNASNVIREYVDAYTAPKNSGGRLKAFSTWVLMPLGAVTMLMIVVGFAFVSFTFAPEKNAVLFTAYDVNADGVLSAADANSENKVALSQFLQFVDTNADGHVSRDEFQSVETFDVSALDPGTHSEGTTHSVSVMAVELEVGTDEK